MKLDIIAQIVQILKDAPEVGAIEIRRGLFGAWSSVRVAKAGHGNTVGAGGGGALGVKPPSSACASRVAPPLGPQGRAPAAGAQLLLKVGRPATIRVNGELVALDVAPLKPEELKSLAEQIMTPRQVKEFAEHKEADFAIGVPGVGRFRTNVYQQRGTVAFAFRAIPYEVKHIHELNLPGVLEEIALKPRGLVLVTGVTGSGKSTALAAMINHVNTNRRVNIITIEDPIEFLHRDQHSNISQREVGNDTLSFNSALRHVLRQDPDLILIGEIRDMETLDTALKAADTGHMVFSTLHTTDATQTINRVISFFPPHQHDEIRHLLSTALQAIVSLRLVPRRDGRGRVPAAEVLINTAAVADNIRDLAKQLSIRDLIAEGSVQYGMQSFDQSLFHWYQQGVISYESAIFYATNPSEFALKVSGVDSSGNGLGGCGPAAAIRLKA